MSQVDYSVMTDEQLKRHIVENREDKAALRAYAERRDEQNFPVIANVRDVDFDSKLQTAISQKLRNPAAT
jgi:hypothetical protein